MSRKFLSKIDLHGQRAAIEREIALGRSCRAIAEKYGLKKDSVIRHKKKLPPQLKAALLGKALAPEADLEKLRITESDHLLQNLAAQRARLLLMQDAAIEAQHSAVVAALSAQIQTKTWNSWESTWVNSQRIRCKPTSTSSWRRSTWS